ncbi:CPBP family intramembrane metalloprotease [Uliginosibacterium sp. 31-16]|uniref:CPBP family intramembrane glutamic endopeptidase n=1 Tax=Uliginosibacterium sp. 31-16 TaxID=3068315 RepID=UPI00273F1A3B|nr:CPBP family intramembrane glutamic endopeptidase [Uliginosibacterium sp. 31-16]MDP5240164.1 CPBP family intramembrane metalloprotease [Uliginosibacterium sp. 31-16]
MHPIASLASFCCLFAALSLGLFPRARRASLAFGALIIPLALSAGLLTNVALASLLPALLLLRLRLATAPCPDWARHLGLGLLALWALAAALHWLPGFTPYLWTQDFGRDSSHVLQWQLDKGLAALLLLWVLPAPPKASPSPARWLALLPGCALLLVLALLSGQARIDPHWLPGGLIWLAGNLFLSVFAEEVFFRGLLQRGLQRLLAPRPQAFAIAVGLSALLFGLVHLPWGLPFAAMATLAGIFYGLMAARENALPRAICAHFALNALTLTLLHSPLA